MSARSSSRSSKPASMAKSSSSSGSCFSLTSLTVTAKLASRPASSLGAVVGGERDRDRALLARRSPRAGPPRSRGSGCRSRARRAGRGPRRRRTGARRPRPAASRRSRSRRSRRQPAARSTVSRRASRSRSPPRASLHARLVATCSSARPTSSPLYSPSSAFGSTPISIEKRSSSPLGGQVGEVEVDLGIADRHDAGALDRVRVPGGQRFAHRLLEHRLAADALDHERRRHLALAEAGELELAPSARARCSTRPSTSPGATSTCRRTRESAELGEGCLHGA